MKYLADQKQFAINEQRKLFWCTILNKLYKLVHGRLGGARPTVLSFGSEDWEVDLFCWNAVIRGVKEVFTSLS